MKLLKPSWVHHDEKPIFSVDVHQECLKFATGGQGNDSGRVVIWNLLPVLSEKIELDHTVPKKLCQMDNHLSCVNCVRWSQSGLMLASGSDDKLVMIWRQSKNPSGVFGTGGIQTNAETWKCAYTLRGHSGDVLDLAWSPQDRWLASCSIDNTTIVWDVQNFPVMISMLKGHTGLVKGVAWDPVGKFLASQSDDRTVKIWKTSDWTCNNTIREPFEECGGTTHILRLSWSPDGQYLVSAHAMNGGGPTAQIIEREGWKCDKDFVGHRKAVTCVRFHTAILKRQISKNQKPQQYCCLAVGSRDRSLSVWMTALQRPLVVIHDLFSDSILDLSWGPEKCILMACSGDGTVACLQFSENELGTPLSEEDKNALYQRIYGKSVNVLENGSAASDVNMVIENAELLHCVQEKIKPPTLLFNSQFNTMAAKPTTAIKTNFTDNCSEFKNQIASSLPPVTVNGMIVINSDNMNSSNNNNNNGNGIDNTNGFKILNNGILNNNNRMAPTVTGSISKQLETRTADGKRRITPVFIPLNQSVLDTSNGTQLNSCSKSPTATNVPFVCNNNNSNNHNNNNNSNNNNDNSSNGNNNNNNNDNNNNNNNNDNNNDNNNNNNNNSMENMQVETRNVDTTNSSAVTIGETNDCVPNSTDKSQHNEGRLDGRLVKNNKLMRLSEAPLIINQELLEEFPHFKRIPAAPAEINRGGILSTSKVFQASTAGPKIPINTITKCEYQKTVLDYRIHVHNGCINTANGFLAKVTAYRLSTGKLWDTLVGSPVVNFNFCPKCVILCSLDGTLRFLDFQTGILIMPIISLTTAATQCAFCPRGRLAGIITECGHLRVWNIETCRAVLSANCSDVFGKNGAVMQFALTENAIPLIMFANGHAYSYSPDLMSWLVLNTKDPLLRHGLQSSLPKEFNKNYLSYPLTSVQTTTNSIAMQSAGIDLNGYNWQLQAKIIFIDNQIKLCEAINSPNELKYWYSMLGYQLALGDNEKRIRLLLNDLLGTPGIESAYILNISKHELLEVILNQLKSHIKWQRIYMEYNELYDTYKKSFNQKLTATTTAIITTTATTATTLKAAITTSLSENKDSITQLRIEEAKPSVNHRNEVQQMDIEMDN